MTYVRANVIRSDREDHPTMPRLRAIAIAAVVVVVTDVTWDGKSRRLSVGWPGRRPTASFLFRLTRGFATATRCVESASGTRPRRAGVEDGGLEVGQARPARVCTGLVVVAEGDRCRVPDVEAAAVLARGRERASLMFDEGAAPPGSFVEPPRKLLALGLGGAPENARAL